MREVVKEYLSNLSKVVEGKKIPVYFSDFDVEERIKFKIDCGCIIFNGIHLLIDCIELFPDFEMCGFWIYFYNEEKLVSYSYVSDILNESLYFVNYGSYLKFKKISIN